MGKKSPQKILILLLILIACVLRVYSGFKQYSGDVNNHIGWATEMIEGGFMGMYERPVKDVSVPNYPPLAMYGFAGSMYMYRVANSLVLLVNQKISFFPSQLVWLFEQKNMVALFLKTPAFLGDALLGLSCYLIFRNLYKSKKASCWALALLFNPALFYVSAVWGQIESLVMAFILFSVYFLQRRQVLYSVIFFTLAALSKQTALWLLPIFGVLWLYDYKEMIKGMFASFFVSFAMYLPFYGFSLRFLESYLLTLAGSSNVTGDKAFNVWFLLFGMVPDSTTVWGLPIRMVSIALLVLIFGGTIMWLLRTKSSYKIWLGLWLTSLAAFFIQTRVHERHLYPAVVLSMFIKSKSAFALYVILSIYLMVNLYWSLGLAFY